MYQIIHNEFYFHGEQEHLSNALDNKRNTAFMIHFQIGRNIYLIYYVNSESQYS
jgi:hypothetical protein